MKTQRRRGSGAGEALASDPEALDLAGDIGDGALLTLQWNFSAGWLFKNLLPFDT